jgi:DNA ligase-associated metallophosphoesterase
LLVVANLHLEKGSSYAERGVLLPPYDTTATLACLSSLMLRYAPRLVIALGDSFHDNDGPARMKESDRAALRMLQRGCDWIWIRGNHDSNPAPPMGGIVGGALALGPLIFRHEPSGLDNEIAGHLHPLARVSKWGRTVSRRCFASDGRCMVLPALGAYCGGLNVRHHAFARVFGGRAFTALVLGERRLYAVPVARCAA